MKRRGEKDRGPGDDAERRRRQFEDSRGLSDRPELPLDEDAEAEPEKPSDKGENEDDRGGGDVE
jgi:hypothetical protein